MLESRRNLARGRGAAAEVERQQDLPSRGMRDRTHDLVESRQLLDRRQRGLAGLQTASTSQMVKSSSTGPIGSHTDITSGV